MIYVVGQLPPLCVSCNALLGRPSVRDCFELAICQHCQDQYVNLLPEWIPTSDQEFAAYYAENIAELMAEFGHPLDIAIQLARNYYLKFTDETFCASIGVPKQGEDFFWHEGKGLALRMHYYLFLKADPNPVKFVEWRKERRSRHVEARKL